MLWLLDDVVILLLEKGARVNTGDKDYQRLLEFAIKSHHEFEGDEDAYKNIIVHLLTYGASKTEHPMYFTMVLQHGNHFTLQAFNDYGINLKSCPIPFPLHEVAKNEDKEILAYLLDGDFLFDLDQVDNSGRTPVFETIKAGNDDSLEALLIRGASPRAPNRSDIWKELVFHLEKTKDKFSRNRFMMIDLLLTYGAHLPIVFYQQILEAWKSHSFRDRNSGCVEKAFLKHFLLRDRMGHIHSPDDSNDMWQYVTLVYAADELDDKLEIIGDQYGSELFKMKMLKYARSLAYYDIATNYIHFGSEAALQCLIDQLEDKDEHCRSFPTFSNVLRSRLDQLKYKKKHIGRASMTLAKIIKLDYDTFYSIYFKIMGYLGPRDIHVLSNFGLDFYNAQS
ncbi:hypothetical protein QAD02_023028 [Eretmocerus hayati]|uniref:Uncharacterized protein n=1 Tax=Eretmocerus hayati TaxID=131215 RepID=A0ACC2PUF5_9HYME|nr:hypothetical protein QAD02_023028 [Eretmocerus hayati]